jgi:hypothetical protein
VALQARGGRGVSEYGCASWQKLGNYQSAIDTLEGSASIRTVSGPNAIGSVFYTSPAALITRTGILFSVLPMVATSIFCLESGTDILYGPSTLHGQLNIVETDSPQGYLE